MDLKYSNKPHLKYAIFLYSYLIWLINRNLDVWKALVNKY